MDNHSYYLEYLKRTSRFPQSVYHKAKHEIVRRLFLSIPHGSRVLDAGCGVGHITGPYCDRYAVFGMDEQLSAVSYCREQWHGSYVHGSLYRIPFENNYFDLIFFLDTIEHLTHPIDVLREFALVMKPGAKILICTMNYANPLWFVLEHTWHRFAGGTCKPYSKDVHPTPYTERLLLEHCAGLFEEVEIEKRIMRMELFLTGRKATE
jgi:ubiquinone/menaquinone biosynthesis C-methylase UbiE